MHKPSSIWPRILLFFGFAMACGNAVANHHLWQVHSVFSNAEGTVQYVQLRNEASGETALSGKTLQARNAAGVVTNTFTFNRNLTGETANRFLLLATPGFAALAGGIEPDFELPAGFVPTGGGSINFAGLNTLTYTAADLPKNGKQARSSGGLIPSNPQNFSQQQAQIAIAPVAFYEPGTQTVRLPVLKIGTEVYDVVLNVITATPIQLRLASFYIYNGSVLTDANAASFAAGVLTVPKVRVGADVLGSTLDLINANNFTFGNLRFIDGNTPDPLPENPGGPDQQQLAESVQRGNTLYSQHCAICHCGSGAGGCSSASPSVLSTVVTHDVLSQYIDIAMPPGTPGVCTGQCADDIANYIIEVLRP